MKKHFEIVTTQRQDKTIVLAKLELKKGYRYER